jgi:hypothetical protein
MSNAIRITLSDVAALLDSSRNPSNKPPKIKADPSRRIAEPERGR